METRTLQGPDVTKDVARVIAWAALLYGASYVIGLAINHIGTIYGDEVDGVEYDEGEEYYEKINTCHHQCVLAGYTYDTPEYYDCMSRCYEGN